MTASEGHRDPGQGDRGRRLLPTSSRLAQSRRSRPRPHDYIARAEPYIRLAQRRLCKSQVSLSCKSRAEEYTSSLHRNILEQVKWLSACVPASRVSSSAARPSLGGDP
jgi:hypothetical protein